MSDLGQGGEADGQGEKEDIGDASSLADYPTACLDMNDSSDSLGTLCQQSDHLTPREGFGGAFIADTRPTKPPETGIADDRLLFLFPHNAS